MFIEKNGVILDKKIIRKEQLLVKKLLFWEIEQIMNKYGFEKEDNIYSSEEVFLICSVYIESKL